MHWSVVVSLLRSKVCLWRYTQNSVGVLLLFSLLLGCGGTGNLASSLKPVYFHRQDEAGSIQVGVQSVAPFEEYVDALQPKFTLTEQQAFDTAIAQTQIENLREIRSLLAKIAVALPSTTKTVEETLSRQDDKTTSSRTETQKKTPPTQPDATAPSIDATLAGVPAAPTDAVAIDAALRYRAAAALYQDIALLNSYVREAAVATDTTPYIVRLLVTVLPSSHRAPYDAYSTVSFFLDRNDRYNAQLYRSEADSKVSQSFKSALYTFRALTLPVKEPSNSPYTSQIQGLKCEGQSVQVVPLFVTDNFESSSQTSARESLRGIEASAGGVVGNIGVGGGLNSRQDTSLGIRGTDLNGLQTLAATSENTIQLRLGAATLDDGYQALSRTYNLTVLVLVPSRVIRAPKENAAANIDCASKDGKDLCKQELFLTCGRVRYSAQSFFRKADKGTMLGSLSPGKMRSALEQQLRAEFGNRTSFSAAIDAAKLFDFEAFKAALQLPGDGAEAAAIWPKVVATVNSWGRSGGPIPLPQSNFKFFDEDGKPTTAKIPLLDDGKTATANIYGAERLEESGKGLHAQISFPCKGTQVGVESSDVTVSKDRRSATFTFPSVKYFVKKVGDERCPLPTLANLQVDFSPTVQRWSKPEDHIVYSVNRTDCPVLVTADDNKNKTAQAEFEIHTTADYIRAKKDGTGEFAVEIRKTGDKSRKVLLTVEGAILQNAASTLSNDLFRQVDTDHAYVLSVTNLLPGHKVTVHSWQAGEKDADKPIPGPDVSLTVIPETESIDCHILAGSCPSGG